MDPWRRFRLLACIVGMLGIVALGGFARLTWGVPDTPYGLRGANGGFQAIRKPNPFQEIVCDFMGLTERH